MSLHFLLKAEARTLSVVQVLAMSDDDAFAVPPPALGRRGGSSLPALRHGAPALMVYSTTRKIWRRAGCQEDFSVTSGTSFAFHKLPLRLYLATVVLFTNAVKGISALQVGRGLGVSHKTAYVLLHEIRESLLMGRDESALQGEIHVPGPTLAGRSGRRTRRKIGSTGAWRRIKTPTSAASW